MGIFLYFLLLIVLTSFAAPVLAPYDPLIPDTEHALSAPSQEHLLGTDLLGRDVFSRVLYGGQRTLSIALLASVTAVLPGVALGIMAGMRNKFLAAVIQIVINSWLAVPMLVTALVIVTLLGRGAVQIALATGIAQIAVVAQVTRTMVLSAFAMEYITGADAIGAGRWHIIRRHIVPHITPLLLAYSGVVFSRSLLNSAALSFLGLAGEPGVPDWGSILAEGRQTFRVTPWVSVAPGVLITLTVFLVNKIASGVARPLK